MQIAKIIASKMKHQSVFTTKANHAQARALYKFYSSKGFKPSKHKSKGYRIQNENGYITFSPKEDYVHIYVRKF
jgi:hypothetical protein